MSDTLAPNQHLYLLWQFPTICAVVALATDQYSSYGCYNCTRPAGLYQPSIKMVMNIFSMQIPYSGVVFGVDTLHSISNMFIFCKLYPSIQMIFYAYRYYFCTLNKHSVTKVTMIPSIQHTLTFITSFFERMFPEIRIFMRTI